MSTNLPLSLPGASLDLSDEGVGKGWFWRGMNDKGGRPSGSTGLSKSASSENALGQPTAGVLDGSDRPVGPSEKCSKCGKELGRGQFVRALGQIFHLSCFRCGDCGVVTANKFFPLDGTDGRQHPYCETDYFRRLNLICANCGKALRGSFITAVGKKYHVEHFRCSICLITFGPQDSYYEHEDDIYCHFHYSTRFATKCTGCATAILKQFVELDRNGRTQCWHPECYMIHKFWNIKLAPSKRAEATGNNPPPTEDVPVAPAYEEEEQIESPATLREKQRRMELLSYRMWTIMSTFEESSAACISDMLQHVQHARYVDALRSGEKFVLHAEALFATIDDMRLKFAQQNVQGVSYLREARLFCRKLVDLYTLIGRQQEIRERSGLTQELLQLVTSLAHYLKLLIRIAISTSLKLKQEGHVENALALFLVRLHLLLKAPDPRSPRMPLCANGEPFALESAEQSNPSTYGAAFGFASLTPEVAGASPLFPRDISIPAAAARPSDTCLKCQETVEEFCVRLGPYQRWHARCVSCAVCGISVFVPPGSLKKSANDNSENDPPLETFKAEVFQYDTRSCEDIPPYGWTPTTFFCPNHSHPNCRTGLREVTLLEQFAYLLNVATRRLFLLLKSKRLVPSEFSPEPNQVTTPLHEIEQQVQELLLELTSDAPITKSTISESYVGLPASSAAFHNQPTRQVNAQGHRPSPLPPLPQFTMVTSGNAQEILDKIWKILDSLESLSAASDMEIAAYRNQLRRISMKIALRHEIFPAALLLHGVSCADNMQRLAGGFADVFRGSYSKTQVALKTLRVQSDVRRTGAERRKLKQQFFHESLLWRALSHENVLSLLGVAEDVVFEGSICMVIPWMPNGSVREYSKDMLRHSQLSDEVFVATVDHWLHQASRGLEYLHSEGIIHGDLHGGNILLDERGHARLTDFGLSLFSEATAYNYGSTHGGGAIRWAAPELIGPEEFGYTSTRPTCASDIYSLACTGIELYTGQSPLHNLSHYQIFVRVVSGTRPPRPTLKGGSIMPDAVWTLITSCWKHQPSQRPSAAFVAHEWALITSHHPPFTLPKLDQSQLDSDEQNEQNGAVDTSDIAWNTLIGLDNQLPLPPSAMASAMSSAPVSFASTPTESDFSPYSLMDEHGSSATPLMHEGRSERDQAGSPSLLRRAFKGLSMTFKR